MKYSRSNPNFTSQFFKLADEAKDIVITSHRSPDGDSIASVLSIYWLLKENYPKKKIQILYTGEATNRYKYFKNFNKIKFTPDIADAIKTTDLLICLDGSQYNRFSYKPEELATKPKKTICIDHHSSPIDKFDLTLVDNNQPSNVQIIYSLFHQNKKIDKKLAEIYLLGILSDTGNFAYLKPHQTDTLLIAKKLLEAGKIEIQVLQAQYDTVSTRIFKIVQEFIKNTQYHQVNNWPNFQASFIDRDFKNENKYTDNEVSEASHIYMAQYLRKIRNHPWGFVISPKLNGDCGLSGRSLPGSVSNRDMSERMGIGGGHDRAAAGDFKKKDKDLKPEDCLKQVLTWMKNNKPVLI